MDAALFALMSAALASTLLQAVTTLLYTYRKGRAESHLQVELKRNLDMATSEVVIRRVLQSTDASKGVDPAELAAIEEALRRHLQRLSTADADIILDGLRQPTDAGRFRYLRKLLVELPSQQSGRHSATDT